MVLSEWHLIAINSLSISLWQSFEGICHQLKEVCCKINPWTRMNVRVWGDRWHTEWWPRSGMTDPHRGPNAPWALCPVYSISSVTPIYTPHHWRLSALGWYMDSTGHFLCRPPTTDAQKCNTKRSSIQEFKQNESCDLQMDLWIWSASFLHVCSYCMRAHHQKGINEDIEHIKSQCWVERLTHLFSAEPYSFRTLNGGQS